MIKTHRAPHRLLMSCLLLGSCFLSPLSLINEALANDSQAKEPRGNTNTHLQRVLPFTIEESDGYGVERIFTGRVAAPESSDIGFDFSGKIIEIYGDLGDTVTKGALLAKQDTALLVTARRELLAQLKELDAQISLNKANLSRYNTLKNKGYASSQKIDELNSEKDILRASRNRVSASLSSNQTQLDKSALYAPYDAVITAKTQGLGGVVAAGTPIFSLNQIGIKQATIGIAPALAKHIQLGDTYALTEGKQTVNARVAGISPELDAQTRTLAIRFDMEGKNAFYAGTLVSLALQESHPTPGFWVPTAALTEGPRGAWNLLAIVPDNEHFVLQARTVRLLHATSNQAYVQGSLRAGESILAAGTHRVVAGQQVRVDATATAN